MEVHPLTPRLAWANFTTSFFIAFVSFGMLIYLIIKEKSADKTLFLVWSIIMLIAVLAQRRFGYYYAVNAALLTGYFSWKMLDIAGLKKLLAGPKQVVGAVKKFKKRERKSREKAKPRTFMQPRGAWVSVIVVGIVIFLLVFLPNIIAARGLAGSPSIIYGNMSGGWYDSLLWLKDNSPEPFGDPDFYYELYPPRAEFKYPETAYGVMSWWDYGYFITQIARRIPNANPTQSGAVQAGRFFTAQNETSANELADRSGSKYVVIDHTMPISKFYAMVEWAGGSLDEFYEVYYYMTQDGTLAPGILYYPAYYNSTVVRLYNFDGQAVLPTESAVISYGEKVTRGGERYKEIISWESFSSYEEARAYVADQASENYRIVSANPFSSPVPLEEVDSYGLAYQSEAKVSVGGKTMPGVKIFEYLGSDGS